MTSGDEDDMLFIIPTDTDPAPDALEAWLHMVLSDLPYPTRLRAALVALELLAGARGRRAAPYVVRLTTRDRRRTLVVSVDDCTAARQDPPLDPNLVLVAGLTTRWGVEQRTRARTTWAELATTDARTPRERRDRTANQSRPTPRPETP